MHFQFFQIFAFANLFSIQCKLSKASSFTRQDSYLTNHVFRTFPEKQDWLDCTRACEQDHKCISYNYHSSGFICELNNQGIEQTWNADSELVFMKGWIYHQMKPATKTLNKQDLPSSCDCNCGTAKQCKVKPKLGDSPEKPAKTCMDILEKRGTVPNGKYYLSATLPYPVYCHMEQIPECDDSGGWTLLMKIDGTRNTFRYSSELWTNEEPYHEEHGHDLEMTETKLKTFSQHQLEKGYCLGMEVNGERNWTFVNMPGGNLFGQIVSKPFEELDASYATKWRSLVKNSSMQTDDVRVGFNNVPIISASYDGARARIGLIAGNGSIFGSRLGFGTSGSAGGVDVSNSCGNEASSDSDKGARSIKAFCIIMAK